MNIPKKIYCPHCQRYHVSVHTLMRMESGPLVERCSACKGYIDLRHVRLEWKLLDGKDQICRYVSTFLISVATGGVFAVLSSCLWGLDLFEIGSEGGVPTSSIISITALSIVVALALFWKMMRADIRGSELRLSDPEYRNMLRAVGKLPEHYE